MANPDRLSNVSDASVEMVLDNGEGVTISLTYAALYRLRASDRKLYDRYNELVRLNESMDELDMLELLWIGYICGTPDADISLEDWFSLVPTDREYIGEKMEAVFRPKKAPSSATPSE